MTRDMTIKALKRYEWAHPDLMDAAIDHLTRDAYRDRLDRMVAARMHIDESPDDAVKWSAKLLAAIDAEVERKQQCQ